MPHTNVKSEWSDGNLIFRDKSGNAILTLNGTTGVATAPAQANVTYQTRQRFTTAQVNAGATVLAAPGAGLAYRLVDLVMIAVGGNAATATSVDIAGTRSASAVLLAVNAIAGLTRSAMLRLGATNSVVLADGASHTALDANTAITIAAVGTLATATHIDVVMTYAVDAA
jgi:hypothetical protein